MNEGFSIDEKWYVCTWYPSYRAKMQNEREQVAIKAGYESAVPVWFHHINAITPTAILVEHHAANPAEIARIRQRGSHVSHGIEYAVLTHTVADGARKTWKHS